MKISASLRNSLEKNDIRVQTNGNSRMLTIPSKPDGYGSAVNGGELLLLSIATCFCNDIYREAGKRDIAVSEVEVTATCEFNAEGEPGTNFRYKVFVKSNASEKEISDLIKHTDSIGEIHNTIRQGTTITLDVAKPEKKPEKKPARTS
jgi:uncharacterized OsmC-like protein